MRQARLTGLTYLVLLLLVASLVAGVGSAPAAAASTKVRHVTIQNFSFAPQTITIKAGTKVTWKNVDGFDHHLASTDSSKTTANITGLFSSKVLGTGATFSFIFKKKGTFFYECTIHASMASMHGKVIVK